MLLLQRIRAVLRTTYQRAAAPSMCLHFDAETMHALGFHPPLLRTGEAAEFVSHKRFSEGEHLRG